MNETQYVYTSGFIYLFTCQGEWKSFITIIEYSSFLIVFSSLSAYFQDNYILRLVTAMEHVFVDKHGVSTALVANVHQHIFKNTGLYLILSPILESFLFSYSRALSRL